MEECRMGIRKEKDFWAVSAIIIITIILMIAVSLHWLRLGLLIGPIRLSHWFVLIGTFYVVFSVPIIFFLKKRSPSKRWILLRLHVFGNLIAFMFVSIHFAGQVSRPAGSFPNLGTGVVLYSAMVLLVATGVSQRFQIISRIRPQTYRFFHTSSAVVFYLTIVVHILHGLGILQNH
jgi:hypothetical protein